MKASFSLIISTLSYDTSFSLSSGKAAIKYWSPLGRTLIKKLVLSSRCSKYTAMKQRSFSCLDRTFVEPVLKSRAAGAVILQEGAYDHQGQDYDH